MADEGGNTVSTDQPGAGQLTEFMLRVLDVVARFDAHEQLWWRCDDEYAPVTFFVECSDLFAWGTADLEPVTPEAVDELARAFAEVTAITDGDPTYAGSLYACRRRGSRPQGAAYPSDARLWPLFDAAGPQREIDLFNPKPRPGEPATEVSHD
jgi:hypothetical protein